MAFYQNICLSYAEFITYFSQCCIYYLLSIIIVGTINIYLFIPKVPLQRIRNILFRKCHTGKPFRTIFRDDEIKCWPLAGRELHHCGHSRRLPSLLSRQIIVSYSMYRYIVGTVTVRTWKPVLRILIRVDPGFSTDPDLF